VAIADGKVVGFAGLWMVVDEAHITTVAVDPQFRRNGIGRKLTKEVLARGKERSATCATLEVRASNESAIRLYEELGFIQSARRKGYYPDNKEDAIVMWKHEL
jgi:ribosomal-protein-alanine N-acetyltransferase